MNKNSNTFDQIRQIRFRRCLVVAGIAGALLAVYAPTDAKVVPMTVRGVVAGSYFTPPAGSAPSSTSASHYGGATVCADVNDNGVCDPGEVRVTTDAGGAFFLSSLNRGPLVV